MVSWGLRRARRYTSLAPKISVKLGEAAEVACIADKAAHLRLQALLVDLSLYKVSWEVGDNDWKFGEEVAAQRLPDSEEDIPAPVM